MLRSDYRRMLLLLVFSLVCFANLHSQQLSVKSNLLYDALLSPNLGLELVVAPKWSVELAGNINFWTVNDHRWKHWMVQSEARYWLCDATAGHFLAAHLLGGKYNVGNIAIGSLKDHRYQGWFTGAGVAYGYSWILGKHFNLEAEIGVGWIHTRYDKFECAGCGKRTDTDTRDYIAPTKAAVNIVYVF